MTTADSAHTDTAPVPDEWDGNGLWIRHTAAEGTVLVGSRKGDGVYDTLKGVGQRWRGLRDGEWAGCLYVPQSRDRPAKRWTIRKAADALREAGWVVRVDIDDTPRDRADVEADQRARLEARSGRLHDRADKLSKQGDAYQERSDQIDERFSGGQPILTGHHSERGARADRRRSDNAMAKSVEARAEATNAELRAQATDAHLASLDSPVQVARRLERLQADRRKITREVEGYTRNFRDGRGNIYRTEVHKPATGGHLVSLQARAAHLDAQIAYDQASLRAHQDAGRWSPVDLEDIKPGDLIQARDRWERVDKVNKATVTVETPPGWDNKVPLIEITGHRAAEDGAS